MTAIPPGLTVREAQILELLRGGADRDRVVRIGHHRRSWTPRDVDDVYAVHIAPPDTTRYRVWRPQPFGGAAQDVVLPRRLVDLLDDVCAGLSNAEIAAAHRKPEETIRSQVKALLRAFGLSDRMTLVVLVLTGRVRVLVPITPKGETQLRLVPGRREDVSEAAERGNAPRPLTRHSALSEGGLR